MTVLPVATIAPCNVEFAPAAVFGAGAVIPPLFNAPPILFCGFTRVLAAPAAGVAEGVVILAPPMVFSVPTRGEPGVVVVVLRPRDVDPEDALPAPETVPAPTVPAAAVPVPPAAAPAPAAPAP